MTKEQANKFWETLLHITAYAEECKEKLEKDFPFPEKEDPRQTVIPDSQGDVRSTLLHYLPKIKERVTELEELLS